jgi:hypothetical protein
MDKEQFNPHWLSLGIEKKNPSKTTVIPYENGPMNKYMIYQVKRLKRTANPNKYWSIVWLILVHSKTFRISAIHHVLENWYKDLPFWSIKKVNRAVTTIFERRLSSLEFYRVYIPKGETHRPLGVPTKEWRIALHMVNNFIQTFTRKSILPSQHGFIPGRGCMTAWKDVMQNVVASAWIYECDLKQFFPSVQVKNCINLLDRLGVPLGTTMWLQRINYSEPILPKELKLNEDMSRTNPFIIDPAKGFGPASYFGAVFNYMIGLPQGAPTSPLLSILTLRRFLTQVPSVSYADDPIFHGNTEFEIRDSPKDGIVLNQEKSGWVKRNGIWMSPLKYLGITYNPYTDSLIASTRKGSTLELTKELRNRILDTFSKKSTRDWSTLFSLKDFGMLFSRLYIGSWKSKYIDQDFTLRYKDNSLVGLIRKEYGMDGASFRNELNTFNISSICCQRLAQVLSSQFTIRKIHSKAADAPTSRSVNFKTLKLSTTQKVEKDKVEKELYSNFNFVDLSNNTATFPMSNMAPIEAIHHVPDKESFSFLSEVNNKLSSISAAQIAESEVDDFEWTPCALYKNMEPDWLESVYSDRLQKVQTELDGIISDLYDIPPKKEIELQSKSERIANEKMYEEWTANNAKIQLPEGKMYRPSPYTFNQPGLSGNIWAKTFLSPNMTPLESIKRNVVEKTNEKIAVPREYSLTGEVYVTNLPEVTKKIATRESIHQDRLNQFTNQVRALTKNRVKHISSGIPKPINSFNTKENLRKKLIQFIASYIIIFFLLYKTDKYLLPVDYYGGDLRDISVSPSFDWQLLFGWLLIALSLFLFFGIWLWYLGVFPNQNIIDDPRSILIRNFVDTTNELERSNRILDLEVKDLQTKVNELTSSNESLYDSFKGLTNVLSDVEIGRQRLESLSNNLLSKLNSIKDTLVVVRQENLDLQNQLSVKFAEFNKTVSLLDSTQKELTLVTDRLDQILFHLDEHDHGIGNLLNDVDKLFLDCPVLNLLNQIGQFTDLDISAARMITSQLANGDEVLVFASNDTTTDLFYGLSLIKDFLIDHPNVTSVAELCQYW